MRLYIIFAAFSGSLSVALGAFGAHALTTMVTPERLAVWHTAVFYQLTHSLAILALIALAPYLTAKWLHISARLFILAIVLFSGSLYTLVLSGNTSLGLITPIGGICFLLAWTSLLIGAILKK